MIFCSGSVLECYYCSFEEGQECGVEVAGIPIQCQMEDSMAKHYGDSCYVAHSGNDNQY